MCANSRAHLPGVGELGAEQQGQIDHPHRDEADEHASDRPVGDVIVAEVVDVDSVVNNRGSKQEPYLPSPSSHSHLLRIHTF